MVLTVTCRRDKRIGVEFRKEESKNSQGNRMKSSRLKKHRIPERLASRNSADHFGLDAAFVNSSFDLKFALI
jgi:hypothetical protein